MTPEVMSFVAVLLVATCALLLATPSVGADDSFNGDVDKRSSHGFQPVSFPCNGHDYQPRCLNGGKGPRKTWTRSGRLCVCYCPSTDWGKWAGPECATADVNDMH